jgi:hypothetical protein
VGDGKGLGYSVRFAYNLANSNSHLESEAVTARHAVFIWRRAIQKLKGIHEILRWLKTPTRHPTTITHHEPVRTGAPAHDLLRQNRGQMLTGHGALQ